MTIPDARPSSPGPSDASSASTAELPEGLLRPAAYPPPIPRSVALATTHASWVFLTEEEVWKVKRPVDYGFLDYTSLEKRRRSCEEEVRLGRRTAPDVYRGVAPVFRDGDGLSLGGPGDVVDYAVRMRRLRDEDSALALARDGRLTPDHLGRLAERLAGFYTQASAAPEHGAPEALGANIAENYEQSRPYAGRFVAAPALRELLAWQEGALAAARPRLLARVEEGKIRDGHGDLRLEHVYFPSEAGSPLVIDPIEFNRRFRCLDVALDVAFLAMELDAQGLPALAAHFLSRFARDTNDYGFYPLLELYLSYRAWVRAKVACFVAADPRTPPDKAQRKAAEAERLFALALTYARPRPACEAVIAVGGLVGSGKSTIAEALTLELGLPVVSSDATRKFLHGLAPTQRGTADVYTEQATRRTYDEVLRRAESVLDAGRGVILDATWSEPTSRAAARELARRRGRPFLFVEVTCDYETLRTRLRARAGARSISDAREDTLPAMTARYQPPTELAPEERLRVEGRHASGGAARLVAERLR
jgi:aminoglycoside phosphotransferase family enzyme/predicted kinase